VQLSHRVQCSSVGSPLALRQARVLFYSSARHPMEIFLAERTSDEENQETLAVKSKCRNVGIPGKDWSGIGIFTVSQLCQSVIRVSPVQVVKD
jgi:hypothetical protein